MPDQMLNLTSQIAAILIAIGILIAIHRMLRTPLKGEAELHTMLELQREQIRQQSRHTIGEFKAAAALVLDDRRHPAAPVVEAQRDHSANNKPEATPALRYNVRPTRLQQQVAVKCK